MKFFRSFLCLLFLLYPAKSARAQQPERKLLIEVIRQTYDIQRTETLVYLRVFSDGFGEAHPTREVDFRTLALKQAQIPASDLAKLKDLLSPSKLSGLADKYERYWGNIDFGNSWEITIGEGEAKRAITLVNFQPFLARTKKKPYPTEIEKLGCMIWTLRQNAFNEPLDHNYVRGCREWGY
jgi:hypothetical protein